MVFKSRINLLPDYLSRNLKVFASIRPIRLSMQNTYVIPRVNTEVARHSFNYAGAKLWNELSNEPAINRFLYRVQEPVENLLF